MNFSKFEEKIGVNFKDKNLLRQAFIHRSYLNENPSLGLEQNERLEFLGDAVLEMAITEYLYKKYPKKTEGEMTALRAALVNAVALSEVANNLNIGDFLLLSKGRIEEGENAANGAKRKIAEEIGLDVEVGKELGKNEYLASDPEKGKIKKSVTCFLALAKNDEIKLKETGGLDDAKWFKMKELPELKMYDDIRGILAEAIKELNKK